MPDYSTQIATNRPINIAANIQANDENTAKNEKIAKTAKDFEAVFLTQMIHHMFAEVKTDEIFGGGHAEETFNTLLYDEYGKAISKAGGIGIAEHVQRELLKSQQLTE